MKKFYRFSIPVNAEVEEKINNEDGSVTIKKVNKQIDKFFFIKKPSYLESQDKQFFYNQKYNQYLNAGILPEILLRKLYLNADGVFANNEKKEYVDSYIRLGEILSEIKSLESEQEITEEKKSKIDSLYLESKNIRENIFTFEEVKQSLFQNSAESLSHDQSLFWCLLFFLYEDESETPVFKGSTFEEKVGSYEEINDIIEEEGKDSEFYSKLIERASFLTSLYYLNPNTPSKDFEELVEKYDKEPKE